MNMVLHDCPTAEIWQANTLSSPHFKNADGGLKTFDFVVANPPFSNKAWTSGLDPANDLYGRFEYGIPPAKNGDYAFLLHMLKSLKSTGKARGHSARTACCSGAAPRRHPHAHRPAGLHQGHHRPACQPVLRHRHPGLHHRAGQGRRRRPQGHLHDRCQQGLHQGRQQEPPARAGHPQDRGHLHPAGGDAQVLRAWCRWPRSRPTTST